MLNKKTQLQKDFPNIKLSKDQAEVADKFLDFVHAPEPSKDDPPMEFLISGFAGSGKTFLVKYLIELYYRDHRVRAAMGKQEPLLEIDFCATTNKAASVLSTEVGFHASTIHSRLNLTVKNNYKTGKTELSQRGPIESLFRQLIFVDEASMISKQLHSLMLDIMKGARIVYIGDSYQLPPVGEKESIVFSTVKNAHFLSQIQRQAAGNPIIQLSQGYRNVLDHAKLDWPDISQFVDNQHVFLYDDKSDQDRKLFGARHAHAYKQAAASNTLQEIKTLAYRNIRVEQTNKYVRKLLKYSGPFEVNEMLMTNKPLHFKGGMLPTDSFVTVLDYEDSEKDGIPGYNMLVLSPDNIRIKVFHPESQKQSRRLQAQYAKNKNWSEFFNIKDNWADL